MYSDSHKFVQVFVYNLNINKVFLAAQLNPFEHFRCYRAFRHLRIRFQPGFQDLAKLPDSVNLVDLFPEPGRIPQPFQLPCCMFAHFPNSLICAFKLD